MPNPQKPRRFAGTLAIVGLALTLTACGTVEEGLVGKPFGTATSKPAPPPLPPSANFSAVDLDSTGPAHGGLHAAILPPTLTPPIDDGPPEAVATSTVHHVLSSVALGADSAPLAAAVGAPGIAPDARFVLLILTPSAPDAATLNSNNEASKTAAENAIRALAGVGIAQDRVEIAAATSTAVGPGEVRLYVR